MVMADDDKARVWTFDFDETITAAPKRLRRIAKAIQQIGDTIIVVTGNPSPRKQILDRLNNDYKFPFDDLVQYEDLESGGIRRADILKQVDAWGAFDDRAGRAPILVKVCPHFFTSAEPTKDVEDNAKGGNKDAKKAVKDGVKRSILLQGGPFGGAVHPYTGLPILQISDDAGVIHRYRVVPRMGEPVAHYVKPDNADGGFG
jgi:hypothetical protein